MTTNKARFTVQYTEAKTIKGEFKNVYKGKEFRKLSDATEFINKLQDRKNVTDIRII